MFPLMSVNICQVTFLMVLVLDYYNNPEYKNVI